jgi:hypothetical protein
MRKRLYFAVAALVTLSAIGSAAFAYRVRIREAVETAAAPALPPAQPYVQAVAPVVAKTPVTPSKSLPAPKPVDVPGANLAVPFTSQAPHANWELPYQEACEEASLIMVDAYLSGESSFTPEEADARILKVVAWQTEHLGYYEDTTAEETARVAREHFGRQASVVALTSMEDVKKQVAKGNAVIIPAAGRLLKNPYFRGQGPLYHMLVVKGFTKDGKIITNDPGTRRGANFLYDPATLWNAIHDWNGGNVTEGAKVMIVIGK